MKSLSPHTLFEISKYFSGVPSVLSVYLLGSANRGELREDSDIDLALLPMIDTKISSIDLYHLTGELGYQFGYEFDIGIIGSDNLVYSKEAIFTGNPFFVRSEMEAQKRVNTILSMYYNFQVERKIVEDAYKIG